MNMKLERDQDSLRWLRPVFYVLGLLGTCQTWGRSAADGTLLHIFHALHGKNGYEEYILPGTQFAARTKFTGIYWPMDYLLKLLVVFFWEAVDGSHPTSSAIGIYFLSQYFGFMTAMYTDSLRRGSKSGFFRTSLWLLFFQVTAVGCSGWIWALSFLSTSSAVNLALKADRASSISILRHVSAVTDSISILMIPAALGLGYLVPSVAMTLVSPDVVSNTFQQFAIATWNIFPILVLLAHLSLPILARLVKLTGLFANRKPLSHISAIRINNSLALLVTFVSHIAISGLSLTTIAFPGIFARGMAQALSPASLAAPPFSVTWGSTVGDGVRSFFLWDQVFGYAVVLLVMVVQLRSVVKVIGREFNWITVMLGTLGITTIAGPGSACLLLSWARDEVLFSHQVT